VDDELAEIWLLSKPAIVERCDTVRRAATTGDESTFEDARSDSHKLAGSVGMFGFAEAGRLASELDALVSRGALADDRRAAVAELVDRLAAAIEDEQ
jgi:HPt (histidine-containing phosphotransfer) domain-containing protein